mgnify:CR=1 FL=1
MVENKAHKWTEEQIWQELKQVSDPEIPVLTVVDMGVVREVTFNESGHLTVTITPTYSGCPAMNEIEQNIRKHLRECGLDNLSVNTQLSPPWTTDWMTDEGKKRLEEYGIAPPEGSTSDKSVLFGEPKKVKCPHCKSMHTELVSQFGSTACKAQYRCLDCREPFDYFKCI